MSTRFVLAGLLVLCCVLSLPALVEADEGYVLKVKLVGEDGEEQFAEIKIDSEHLRARVDGAEEFILDPEGFTVISHADESYMPLTFQMLEMFAGGMDDFSKGMQSSKDAQREAMLKQLESLPPKEREEAMAEMRKRGYLDDEESSEEIADYTIRALKDEETIAGLHTVKHEVKKGDEFLGHVWIADEIPSDVITNTVKRLIDIAPKQMMDPGDAEDLNLFAALGGFPAKMETSGGEGIQMFEIIEAKKTKFGAKDWKAPTTYTPSMMEIREHGLVIGANFLSWRGMTGFRWNHYDEIDWGTACYLPMVRDDRLNKPDRDFHLKPLFPRYVFVYASDKESHYALTTRCVSRILRVDDEPRLQSDLLRLHQIIKAEVPLEIEPSAFGGDKVSIRSGTLEGIAGRATADQRLLVTVDCLKLAVSMPISGYEVERA